MKTEKRDDATQPLLTAKYSNSTRRGHPSVNEAAALMRSMSERPDEIFDMVERYGYDIAAALTASADEREGYDEPFEEREGTEEQRGDNYILNLIDRLNLKDVIGKLQGQSDATQKQAPEAELEQAVNVEELVEKLQREEEKTKELCGLLEKAERQYQEEREDRNSVISALEVKLALQDRTFSTRLDSEERKIAVLKDKLRAKVSESKKDTENSHSNEEQEKQQQRIEQLENEIVDANAKRLGLEASLEARQSTYDYYISSATTRIQELEQKHEESQKSHEAESAQTKQWELTVAKAETILELDRKKIKTLQLSGSRTKMLLEAERKRAEALESLNDKMRTAMRRLTKKAVVIGGAHEEIERLKNALEKKDKMLKSIYKVLGVDPEGCSEVVGGTKIRPIQVRGKNNLVSYQRKLDAIKASKFTITNNSSDGSSCTEASTVWDE